VSQRWLLSQATSSRQLAQNNEKLVSRSLSWWTACPVVDPRRWPLEQFGYVILKSGTVCFGRDIYFVSIPKSKSLIKIRKNAGLEQILEVLHSTLTSMLTVHHWYILFVDYLVSKPSSISVRLNNSNWWATSLNAFENQDLAAGHLTW